MRSLALIALVVSFAGCLLFDDRGGQSPCVSGADLGAPAFEPTPLRNPENLICQSFGAPCDPSCGVCPPQAGFAPTPTWGICGSSCDSLDESTCSTRPDCRIAKDARCAVFADCTTDFLGCLPTDSFTQSVDCFAATDGQTCSRSSACTALHRVEPCPLGIGVECSTPFAMCVPEGQSPGQCFQPVTCRAIGPNCPLDTTPGIENGCFTGACIPMDLCGPVAAK